MLVPASLLMETAMKLDCQGIMNKPSNITDVNWLHGIARNWSGFVMRNSPIAQNSLQNGIQVRFVDGVIRHIVRQEQSGAYLHIFLDGQALEGALVGYPNKFEVVK